RRACSVSGWAPGHDGGSAMITQRLQAVHPVEALRARPDIARWARPAVLIGGASVIIGSLAPWASYFFGYPGKVTLGGFPGGARIFTLLLALSAVLVVVDVPARRRAGLAAGLGALAVGAYNLVSIANDGNGTVALAWGIYVTVG